jgi:transglutaminase/protease-like cytokinesis protein 3
VCEGYARLLVALGALTKDPIVFVPGDVREESGAMAPVGHAWNAAFVEGAWYLIDATWDDPVDENERSTSYRTDHLFIPPSVAVWSHLPDDPRWQLLTHPLSRGDFLRQPFSRPGIAVHGLTVRSPSRVTVEASEVLPVQLDNPLRRWLIVSFKDGSGRKRECANTNAERVDLRCPVPSTGELAVFANEQQYGRYGQVLSVAVTRR